MKFSVNYRDLTDEQKASAQRATKTVREIKIAVRSVSFGVERVVKQTMPVRYGGARSSWGHWTPALLVNQEGASAS